MYIKELHISTSKTTKLQNLSQIDVLVLEFNKLILIHHWQKLKLQKPFKNISNYVRPCPHYFPKIKQL